jgi:hypothetical protein
VGIAVKQLGYVFVGEGATDHNFYEYNPANNQWRPRANIDNEFSANSIGFSICDKVYLGTGNAVFSHVTDHLLEYDARKDSWSRKADFMGGARNGAVGFSLLDKGYVGMGDFGLTDWYEYRPDTCMPTSVIELTAFDYDLSCQPNPVDYELMIRTPHPDAVEVVLNDLCGKVVFRSQFTNAISVDMSNISSGVYLYEIKGARGFAKRGKITKR